MTETAVAVAVAAGVATFFSPCAYALLPGYVGFYVAATETESPPLGGAIVRGLAAVGGVLVTFLALGGVASVVGGALRSVLPGIELGVGGLMIVLGAALAAGKSTELTVPLPARRTSIAGFVGFGALYALAAAGCVAPLFFAVVAQSLTLSPVGAATVFATYAGVFGALLLGATVATAVGNDLAASTVAPYAKRATRLAGVLVFVAGLAQIAIALGVLSG